MLRESVKNQNGVTLLELVVVLAIMAIIASFAVPSFTASIAQARLKVLVETLRSDLIDAQRSVLAQGAAGTSLLAALLAEFVQVSGLFHLNIT